MYSELAYLFSKAIKRILLLPAVKNSILHKSSRVCSGSHLVNVKMDRYSYIGNFCTVIDCEIGSYCSIADNCVIGGAYHPINWVSSSPVFHKGRNILRKNFSLHEFETNKKTKIENDVWIGSNSLIKSGVRIGDGVIIGMGSVVTHDIPPYTIVAGNPARVMRKRFDDTISDALLAMKWWELSESDIDKLSCYINKPDTFINAWRNKHEDCSLG